MRMGASTQGRFGDGGATAEAAPSTISEAAFGTSSTRTAKGSLGSALAPNDAFGIAHVAGLGSTLFLIWLWWSLPN